MSALAELRHSPLQAKDTLSPHVPRVAADVRLGSVLDGKEAGSITHVAVFDGARFLGLADVRQALTSSPERIAADLVPRPAPPPLAPDCPVPAILERMGECEAGALPVLDSEGEYLGSVTRESLLDALLAEQERLSSLLEAARERAAEQARRSDELYAASRELLKLLGGSASHREVLLEKGLEALRRVLDAKYAAAHLLDERGDTVAFVHCGLSDEEAGRMVGHPPPKGEGILGTLAAGEVLRLDDLTKDPRHRGFGPPAHPRMKSFLGVPISQGGRVYGRAYLTDKAGGESFTAEDELVALSFAQAIAMALDNARLVADKDKRAAYLAALNRIIGTVWQASGDLGTMLGAVLDQTLQTLELKLGGVWVVLGGSRRRYAALRGLPEQAGEAIVAAVRAQGVSMSRPIVTHDWGREAGALAEVLTGLGIRASITVGLFGKDGLIGGLSVASAAPCAWSPNEVGLVEAVGREVARAVERVETEQAEGLGRGRELGAWLELLCREYEELFPGALCSVLLLEGRTLRHAAAPSLPGAYCRSVDGITIGPQAGSCGTAAHRGEPVIVADIETNPLWADYREVARSHGLRACWSIPLRSPEGEVLGTFAVYHRAPHSPTAEELATMERWAHLASLAVARLRDRQLLLESQEALASEAALTGALLDALPGPVFLADAEGRLLRWNKAAEQMAGAPLAGRSVVAVAAPEDQPVVLEAVREALEKGRAAKEVRLRGPRGEPVPYYCVAVRYDTDQGPRLVGIGIDLSERKHLEAELRQAHKMEAIGRLAGGVAHDFNNLLTVIASYGELLLASLPPGDSRRDDATSILEAVKRAASLTRQLLTFGRQSVLEPKVLDLNAVVRETERLLRRVIGEDIELDTRLDPSCHAVRVDPDQLGQVLMNLAANARDAMPWGGRLSIATRNVELDQAYCESHAGARPGTYVELAVSDTGTGIPPEVKARIFEPYFTTKELGKGSGLGLAVVYGIVKQSCGYIEVHSEPGAGTTFRLYFPAMAGCPVIETAGAHPRADPAAMPVRGRNETVLVVEDEDQLRQITARALEKHGYRVLSARGAEEALQLVAEEGAAPDLLVTDVVMPGPSGRQLAETLQRRYPGLKTVFMSGYADDAVIRHGLVHGEITYLQKPFSLSDLVQKVREALDDR